MVGRMAWKSIDTAPKDGRTVLLFDGRPHIGSYEEPWEKVIHRLTYDDVIHRGGWMTLAASCVESCQWGLKPTHWDELPELPDGGNHAVDSQAGQGSHQEGRSV